MLTRRELLAAGVASAVAGPLRAESTSRRGGADEMVLVPAGPFLMGTRPEDAERLARKFGYHVSWFAGEWPQRRVDLPAYRIDRYPVTNRAFAEFCRATGYPPRSYWQGAAPPEALLDHPVVQVGQPDAAAYAKWIGKRLPTEAEWEKAARGTDGRTYPWGDEFDPAACCWNRDGRGPTTAPVTAFPSGASPYGAMQMAGNVAEWCADGPGPMSAFCKGGGWITTEVVNLRPAARGMSGWKTNASHFYGFRCVKEIG